MEKNDLEKIIDLYGNDILSFCHYLTRNREEAEDLCQDTFLLAFKKADAIGERETTKSYLLSIAIHLWKNRKRKFAWRKRISDDRINPVLCGEYDSNQTDSDPKNIASRAETQQAVRGCVDRLPEKLKIPILLYYMEGLKEREIAETLSIPVGTVKSRISQAKTELSKMLAKANIEIETEG